MVVRTTARFIARTEGVSHQFFESIDEAVSWLDLASASATEAATPAYGTPAVAPRPAAPS